MNASLLLRPSSLFVACLLVAPLGLGGCSASRSAVDSGNPSETTVRVSRDVLTAEQIRGYPSATTVEELLEQHFTSLYVRRRHHVPGGDASVYMLGREGPLFVIDGVPVEHKGSLGLNPYDIESITLVKFGATALYGFRGGSGAILITTRQR